MVNAAQSSRTTSTPKQRIMFSVIST